MTRLVHQRQIADSSSLPSRVTESAVAALQLWDSWADWNPASEPVGTHLGEDDIRWAQGGFA
ncbi:hypothetical protein LY78DRAFT_655870 [Colletotrichum sublineola]|nr:hypothetical protein LY78DRAFT_655870 [Colletotrichum sublineola]